jgi:hypothetical protein
MNVTIKFDGWVEFQIPTLPENKYHEPAERNIFIHLRTTRSKTKPDHGVFSVKILII